MSSCRYRISARALVAGPPGFRTKQDLRRPCLIFWTDEDRGAFSAPPSPCAPAARQRSCGSQDHFGERLLGATPSKRSNNSSLSSTPKKAWDRALVAGSEGTCSSFGRERDAKRSVALRVKRLHSMGRMKAILALAAAIASLDCASSALRAELAQRPQNRALQAPVQAKASREQDIALPRPKPNDIRAKERRTKDTRTRDKKDTRDINAHKG